MAQSTEHLKHECTEHFGDSHFLTFSHDLWRYLEDIAELSKATASQLSSKKLRPYAEDFLQSEVGVLYWPLSEWNQWQFEISSKKTIAFVANPILKEARMSLGHVESDAQNLHTPTTKSKTNRTSRKEADLLPSEESVAEASSTGKLANTSSAKWINATESFNEFHHGDSDNSLESNPVKARTSSNYAAFAVRDIPSSRPLFPRDVASSTKSMPASSDDVVITLFENPPYIQRQISDCSDKERVSIDGASVMYSDRDATVVPDFPRSTSPTVTTTTTHIKRKRQATDDIALGVPTSDSGTSSSRPGKRVSFEPPDDESFISESDSDMTGSKSPLLSELDLRSPEEPSTALDSKPRNYHTVNADVSQVNYISVSGLSLELEQFRRWPDQILQYIKDCQCESTRSAQDAREWQTQSYFRSRSLFFNELHADLDSRLLCLASDVQENHRVKFCYSLESSKLYNRL